MIREGAIYLLLLITLSLLLHPDLLSDPAARFSQMLGRENYFHPLLYALPVYLIVLLFRSILQLFRYLIRQNEG
ncbi:hypothetical protein ACXWTF_10770 [Thiomicrolovo sp. ZZH C-3]